jgi:hypothetical protein
LIVYCPQVILGGSQSVQIVEKSLHINTRAITLSRIVFTAGVVLLESDPCRVESEDTGRKELQSAIIFRIFLFAKSSLSAGNIFTASFPLSGDAV